MDRAEVLHRIRALSPWFQTIDFGGGLRVQRDPVHGGPIDYPQPLWKQLRPILPSRIEGLKVLDVGCNAGFFSIEMKRLGASYVLGIDSVPEYLEQAKLVRDVLDAEIDLRLLSVYEIGENLGQFDIVLFLGVLYHLKHPLLALERLATVTKGVLVIESAILPNSGEVNRPATPLGSLTGFIKDKWFSEGEPSPRPHYTLNYGGLPHWLLFNEPKLEAPEAVLNWFVPTFGCLKAFLRVSGFREIVAESAVGDRAILLAHRLPPGVLSHPGGARPEAPAMGG